jgi:hypothetical protein
MENIFIDNLVTLNVLNIDSFLSRTEKKDKQQKVRNVKQQIVWINTKDPNVVGMWEKKDTSKLKKHYGAAIKNILPSQQSSVGGDDIDVDDADDADDIDVDEITFDNDDMDDILKDDDEDEKKKDTVIVEKPFIFVKDIYVFPEDKVSEFKRKIYIASGIPPYRQHLWYEFKGKAYPLSYTITYDTQLPVDIRELTNHINFYEGIPVDTRWYSIKDGLRVTAMDEFQLLDQIYYKHGVTEYFVVDLNDFINPLRGNLERLIKKDLYSIELIYYSFIMKYWPQLSLTVFGEYIKNEEILLEKYPDLAPGITTLKNMYKLETSIVGKNYSPEIDEKKWDVPMYVSITYSVISVTEQYVLPGSIINLRNLFDIFVLDSTVNYVMCNIEIDGRPVILTKKYKTTKINTGTKVASNVMLFNIQIPDHGRMYLTINKKGNYKIESRWREDQNLNFAMIYSQVEKYAKPVIEKINTFGKLVSNNQLTVIKNDNSVFTDINISMFWKFNISKLKFQDVKNILSNYVKAGIMTKSSAGVSISHDYYFTKGMYKYDMNRYRQFNNVQNQYQYLTDDIVKKHHETLITKRKKLNITHRFSDIKIDFTGLKEQEYITFYMYILRLLESIPRVKGEKQVNTDKKLKQLKEKDPSLYEFKKIYDSNIVYSKLCQQQKQPIMYNEPGKNRVKYWNFTTNEPAFYGCPNPKYPHINFITHAHPKKYCIPCCYKLPPSTNIKDKKGNVYKHCMDNKTYDTDKKNITMSRYVMSYGKNIEVGRLSKLPEDTLEPLFYDTFSTDVNSIDTECEKEKGYYLFGVPQNIKNVSNVGFLFSISHALGKDIIEFITESIVKIKKMCDCWSMLLNGTIIYYFNTFTDFVDEFHAVFIGDKMSTFEHWNELFIDITRIYWSVSVVHFIDDSSIKESNSIYLNIPGYIHYQDDYVTTNKHLFVVEKNNTFYPIYVVYKDIFFKVGNIDTKLYSHTETVVREIFNLVGYYIKQTKFNDAIDLFLIKKFIQNSKYNIESQYVNSANFCYGVMLKYIPQKKRTELDSHIMVDGIYEDLVDEFNKQTKISKELSFFIPIKESYYKTDGTYIIFNPPSEENSPDWKTISKFMGELNMFIQQYSKIKINDTHTKQTIYPLLKVENWLLFDPFPYTSKQKKVIGFRCNSYHYLLHPMEETDALKIHSVEMIKILYSPYEVNNALSKKLKPVGDDRFKKISSCLYNNYLYPILVIELINVMDKQRNTIIRKKINTIVTDNRQNDLFELLKNYPNDYNVIRKLLMNNSNITHKKKKKMVIEDFLVKKIFNRSEILNVIENSVFDFDRMLFSKLKDMSQKDLFKELESIFSKITVDMEPTFNGEFPNIIMSCEINQPYCSSKKLMITKKKLHEILYIMASDILNPVKSKYIFSPIFVKNTIDYFKFIIRKDEHITISL